MSLESEKAQLLMEDAFARFKQSYTAVAQTLETIKLSSSDNSKVPTAPPKDISTISENQARGTKPVKRRFGKSRSLLKVVRSDGR
jgi:hypothetical protein